MTTELLTDADLDRARAELEDLVRIPSISADPAHDGDVRASADAVVALMEESGLDDVRQIVVDGGPPYVVGEWVHADDAPTVLLYAHHDVQPPGYVVVRVQQHGRRVVGVHPFADDIRRPAVDDDLAHVIEAGLLH